MHSSRAERLLGLLNDDILALPIASSPRVEPEPHLNGQKELTPSECEGSPEPSSNDKAPVSVAEQKIEALAEALSLRDRSPSPDGSTISHEPDCSESSHEPDTHEDSPAVDLCRGDLAPWGEAYVSIKAASQFPYKFLNRAYSDQVAKKFFDRNQFWSRDWDLYYVWPPADLASKPLVLITLTQFQLLVHEINQYKRHIDFQLTDHHRDCGLILDIPHRAFTPRYLGFSSSRDEYNDMEQNRVPPPSYKAPGEPVLPSADKPTIEAYKAMIEETLQLNKAKSKAAKAKRKEQRITHQQNWGRLLKRTQRYLGLRPDKGDGYNPLEDATLNWADLQAAQAARKLPPVDAEKPAPFLFDKNVIFISVDIEAFELDTSKITEVGVATLDVLDIIDVPPGKDAKNWFDKIRARHFRIHEHAHLENYRHVSGCAGSFEFGTSEFVRLAEAPSIVASCFRPPFSAELTPAESQRLWSANGDESSSAAQHDDPSVVNADGKRNLIFVGHDPNQDVKFLQKLGYNPLNLSNLLEIIDTKLLHQHWKRDPQGTSLGKILADLDIVGWKLHNGGNDAVYTLQALLALAVRESTVRGTKEVEEQRKQDQQKRMADAIADAVTRVTDDADGWSSAGEGDDGGNPKPVNGTTTADNNTSNAAPYVPPPGLDNPAESDCIFVGNLPYRATPEDVVAFFAKYGTITDVHLPINHATGHTKGVAYVSFGSPAEAKNAFEKTKGVEFWSRPIRVDMAPPREKKGGRSGGNIGNGGGPRSQRSSRSGTPVPRTGNGAAVRITDPAARSALQSKRQQNGGVVEAENGERGAGGGAGNGAADVDLLTGPTKQYSKQELPHDWW
ncbi:putative RNA-binding protein RbpB [Lasiodiplodia theobromae]|uniref:Putative RNA-binding protein RbpB n=1 Tax=Lasiodiplodia theobromae TaxID=45133 RepID=A0A5N5D1Y0_9PEZI|nr:putative RNA-binding protein RbpB [Lasiodiplodia theobromae]